MPGFGLRGGDIDKKGVVWASLGERTPRQLRPPQVQGATQRPKATGDHCPEGWAFYQYPGPGFQGIGENSAEVELLQLGRPARHVGTRQGRADLDRQPEGRLAALKDGKMVLLRMPYPLGFYAKGVDGRIDDPNGGWKGRGLWSRAAIARRG